MKVTERNDSHRLALENCSALEKLTTATVNSMFEQMEVHEYDAGEQLMEEGAPGDYIFFILSGTALAWSMSTSQDDRLIASFGPGDVVGEMALVMDEPRSASVAAETRVRALALPASAFEAMAVKNPELGVVLTYLVADRLGQRGVDGLGGKVVGGYRIRRAIGRGNMGVVYLAVRKGTTDPVALKMMSHRLNFKPGGPRRFEREADILLTLEHPHVAKFHERFSALRTSFIVMDYYGGPTVAAMVKKHGRLPESDAMKILGQTASALGYLHGRDIIHRDLKPENMITSTDGNLRLTDFGLAKDLTPAMRTSTTGMNELLGTPLYMAPEQLYSNHPVTAPVDIYALGCIGLELLNGFLPFGGSTIGVLTESKAKFMMPPAKDIGEGIGAELHEVLSRALAHDPAERTVDLEQVSAWGAPLRAELLTSD